MGTPIGGFSGVPTLVPSLSTDPASPASTGLSAYAADLENALNRSIGLAALPLQELQNEQSQLSGQSSALSALDMQFSALQSAIANMVSAGGNLLASTVSDSTVLTASDSAGALAGTYTVQVTDAGSFASAISSNGLAKVTDPSVSSISTASSLVLTVDGVTHTIKPAAKTLNALAAAINADASTGVSATIVNVGPPTAPDYRLSLQSNSLGSMTIQLNDGKDLMTAQTPGSSAQYQVNGSPATPISTNSQTVTIAPGVTVNLLKAGASTVTVAPSASSLSNALSGFTTAFNASVDELNKSRGQNAGPLSGQSVIFDLTQMLHGLANYSDGSGSFTTLTDLGLQFDTNGHLTFDSSALDTLSSSRLADLTSFLGSATGGGFLEFATNQLNAIEDPTNGILKTAMTSTSNQITHENQLIADQQAHIRQLQTSLQAKMAKADALISQIEQQVSYFTGLFQSMYLPRQSQF